MQSLHLLKRAYDGGLLSAEEFDQWRREMVKELVSASGHAGVPPAMHELATFGPSSRITMETPPVTPTHPIHRTPHIQQHYAAATAVRPTYGQGETETVGPTTTASHTPQHQQTTRPDTRTPNNTVPHQPRFEEIPLSSDSDDDKTPSRGGGLCGGGGGVPQSPDEIDAAESGRLPSYYRRRQRHRSVGWGCFSGICGSSAGQKRSKGRSSSSNCQMLAGGFVASMIMGTVLAVLLLLGGLWATGLSGDAMAMVASRMNGATAVSPDGGILSAEMMANEKPWTHAEQDELLGKVMSHPQGAQQPAHGENSPKQQREKEIKKIANRWAKGWGSGLHRQKLDDREEQHCRLPSPKPPVKHLKAMAARMMDLGKCEGEQVAWVDNDRIVFNRTLCRSGFPRYVAADVPHDGEPQMVDETTGSPVMPAEIVHAYCHNHHNVLVRQMVDYSALQRAKDGQAARSDASGRPMDVLLLVLDSVSRAQFHRALPKTVAYLDTLKAGKRARSYQFFKAMGRAQKLDNEFDLFSGAGAFEDGDGGRTSSNPWLWDHYKANGYVTAWLRQPCQDEWSSDLLPNTDHVINVPGCAGGAETWMDAYSVNPRCFGGKPAHSYTFEYLQQFYDNYHGVGRMAVATLHEGNDESLTVLRSLDVDFAKFLKKMHSTHENLVTMIVSPNGMHHGAYHESDAGEAEHHLPALFVVAPSWHIKQHPGMDAGITANSNRLVTHRDVYAALRQLATPAAPKDTAPWVHSILTEVPPHRSCADARLDGADCACVGASGSVGGMRHGALKDVPHPPTDGKQKGSKIVGINSPAEMGSYQPEEKGYNEEEEEEGSGSADEESNDEISSSSDDADAGSEAEIDADEGNQESKNGGQILMEGIHSRVDGKAPAPTSEPEENIEDILNDDMEDVPGVLSNQ